MKKFNVLLAAIFILAMGFGFGVSTVEAKGKKENVDKSQAVIASMPENNKPSWLYDLPEGDDVWGIGYANLRNSSLAMRTATSRAQRNLAEQIGSFVQDILTDWALESGLQDNPRSLMCIEMTGRSIVEMNLSNARINARWQAPDGTWWIRVMITSDDAMGRVPSIITNEFADYADFRADQAIQRLDFERSRSQSNPILFLTDE